MGTRAFVQFPIYKHADTIAYGDVLLPIWGDKIGDIFVYVQYDGDMLPNHLQVVLQEATKQKYRHEVPMTVEQKLRACDPERIAAELVEDLYDDSTGGETSTRISSVQPKEGFHLVCDFKSQLVTYVWKAYPNTVFHLPLWIKPETGVAFRSSALYEDEMAQKD